VSLFNSIPCALNPRERAIITLVPFPQPQSINEGKGSDSGFL